MEMKTINTGFAVNNGHPDSLAQASDFINENFTELNSAVGAGSIPKKLVLVMDSLGNQHETINDSGDDQDVAVLYRGFVHWLMMYLDHPLQYMVGALDQEDDTDKRLGDHNQGVSGDTIGQIRARLDTVKATKAGVYWLHVSTNDANAGTALADFTVDYDYVAAELVNSPAKLIVSTMWSQTDLTTDERKLQEAYNQVIRRTATKLPNTILIDLAKAVTDYSNGDGLPLAAYVSDTVHLTAIGAEAIAADAMEDTYIKNGGLGPANYLVPMGPNDLFDATLNPYGFINDNPLFYGTGGAVGANATLIGAGLADGYTVLTDSANVTVTAEMVDAPTDKPWMRGKYMKVVMTSDGAGSSGRRVRVYKSGSGTIDINHKLGSVYRGFFGYKQEAASSGGSIIEMIDNKVQDKATASAASGSTLGLFPDKEFSAQCASSLLFIQNKDEAASNGFYFQCNIFVDASVAGTQTFYIGQFGFRELDPAELMFDLPQVA